MRSLAALLLHLGVCTMRVQGTSVELEGSDLEDYFISKIYAKACEGTMQCSCVAVLPVRVDVALVIGYSSRLRFYHVELPFQRPKNRTPVRLSFPLNKSCETVTALA